MREILRSPEYFAQVNSVLLLDGMHAGYFYFNCQIRFCRN